MTIIIILTTVLTWMVCNTFISISRRHQERSRVHINIQHVLDDAADVSMSVQRLTEQMGGRS